MTGWVLTAGLTVLVVVLTGFLVERRITTAAFDRLEAEGTTRAAQQLSLALDSELRLLRSYGTTNSVWDDAYQSVLDADQDAFAEAFPPDQVHGLSGVDGALGVAPDGTPRTGGMVMDDATYADPPAELASAEVLARLFVATGEPGDATCGMVTTATWPVLFCGLPAYDSAAEQQPAGGLVFLKALTADAMATMSERVHAPLSIVSAARGGGQRQADLTALAGTVGVTTAATGDDRLVVDAAIPAVNGGTVVLEATTSRPIHQMAGDTATDTLLLMLGSGVLLLAVMLVLMRRGLRQQVEPLRRTAQSVIDSGDWSLRIGQTGHGEIAGLGGVIDAMLDVIETKTAEAEQHHEERQAEMRQAFERQHQAEEQALARAQAVLDDTSALVVGPLAGVATQVAAVRTAADQIDQQVAAAGQVTGEVIGQAGAADGVLAALGESLRQVGGIAQMINGLAEQTNLLALNATIEASRAGAAGAGFHVVATEVKTLAQRTASSTEEIAGAIGALQDSATAVTAAIGAMTAGLAGIDGATRAIRQAAESQRLTMVELDSQVGQALTTARQMAEHRPGGAEVPETFR